MPIVRPIARFFNLAAGVLTAALAVFPATGAGTPQQAVAADASERGRAVFSRGAEALEKGNADEALKFFGEAGKTDAGIWKFRANSGAILVLLRRGDVAAAAERLGVLDCGNFPEAYYHKDTLALLCAACKGDEKEFSGCGS